MEKYICIGDVHGRYDLLQQVLAQKDREYPTHRLLFLGDYIDRGPDSFKVVDAIKSRVETGAVAVLGNHEEFMLNYIQYGQMNNQSAWLMTNNGGKKTIESYQNAAKDFSHSAIFRVPATHGHLQFLKSLPLFFETETIFASHAPIHKDQKFHGDRMWTSDLNENLLWNYFEDEENALDRGKISVCGHLHALRRQILVPRVFPQMVYCDTGCGCASWGPLTAAVIEDGKYLGYFQAVPEHSETLS